MDSEKKLQPLDLLMHEEDEGVLEQVNTLLTQGSYDHRDEMEGSLKTSIEEGLKDIEEGRVFGHKEAIEKLNEEFGK
jgi:hypothetical protein